MIRNLSYIAKHENKSITQEDINKIITENNNISLEVILSYETIIDEIKKKNITIINYFNKEKVKQMIDYIIKEPPDDYNNDKGYKYPWLCSQIFELGNDEIMKYFLKTNNELNKKESIDDNSNKNSNEENNDDNNRIELLDYTLSFLSNKGELNYVLCGYFESLLKILLKLDQVCIIRYLYFQSKDSIKQLINHSYRQSISDILNKIIQYDSKDEKICNQEISLIKMEILEELFDKIDINMETEKFYSILDFVKNLSTEQKLFNDLLNNKKIITCLISKPLRDINLVKNDNNNNLLIAKRNNFIILFDVIINWVNSINTYDIDLPSMNIVEFEEDGEQKNKSKNINHTLLSYELFLILENLIKINFNRSEVSNDIQQQKIMQSFDNAYLTPLGEYRIKIVELLAHLFPYFQKIPNPYDNLLINTNFFYHSFLYLFEYEFNNIYQESFLLLFKKYLNNSDKHTLLSEFLFNEFKLMDVIISKLTNTEICPPQNNTISLDKFHYKSGNTTSRGYISFLISLSYKINTIIGGDALRINDTLSREGSMSFTTRTAPFVSKEEIHDFYGIGEDELYEKVSNNSKEEASKKNRAIKSMEKYLNEKWSNFFNTYISDKIKLYETKLCKDAKNDTLSNNPFLSNDDEEGTTSGKNFGLGDDDEDEEEDILSNIIKKGKDDNDRIKNDFDKDIDINNRFKMSMRLPSRTNKLNINNFFEEKNNEPKKILVDEIDENENKSNINQKNEEEKKNDINKDDDDEEDNPLDKLNNKKNDDEDNPLDKLKKNDDNIYEDNIYEDNIYEDKKDNENIYEDKNDNEIIYEDKNDNDNIYEKIEEEDNPLDKLKKK